jgi:hypothetical protein
MLEDLRFNKAMCRALVRVCRSYRYNVCAGAYRANRNIATRGGWLWTLTVHEEWLASLIRACMNAAPQSAVYEEAPALLDQSLESITRACPDDEVIDSLWRLGGSEALATFCHEYDGPIAMLGYIYSFDHDSIIP